MGEALADDHVHWWIFCVVTVVFFLTSVEMGYRFGKIKKKDLDPEQKSQVGTVLGALLALFSFLLAFSFSIAEERFGERKAILIKDANAIGTTFLRTDFLPAPTRVEVQNLIYRYASLRLNVLQITDFAEALRETKELQNQIWKRASHAASENPRSISLGLLIKSLNEMIDVHEERVVVVLSYHLPPSLKWTLYLVSFITMLTLGFYFGLGGTRNAFATYALVFSVSAVLLLIIDLDQVRQHFFTIDQKAITDVVKEIEASLKRG